MAQHPITEETLRSIIAKEMKPVMDLASTNANSISRLIKYTFGNGTAGADERLREQERVSIRHESELKEIRAFIKDIEPVIVYSKIFLFVTSIVGASIIALIWSLITGQVELVSR